MKVSPFRIGLALAVAGIIWISIVFADGEKVLEGTVLKQSGSLETELQMTGKGIGFYKVHMPEFAGEGVFVQVLDVRDNVIREEMVQTRMAVGYFDFGEDGEYAVRVTNLAENRIGLEVEFGDTNSEEMTLPGMMVFGGMVSMIIVSYFRIKNYRIAQPDENIS